MVTGKDKIYDTTKDDDYEIATFLFTLPNGATVITAYSDPTAADTDGDAIDDVEEKRHGLEPRHLDSDGDGVESSFFQLPASKAGVGLPDGVEPLWYRNLYDGDSLINALDNDSDGDGDGVTDGVEALVVFRSERANYTGDIGVYVDGSDHAALTAAPDPALDTFTYYDETANTSGGTPLVFESQVLTTPDGRLVYYDANNSIIYLLDSLTGYAYQYNATANSSLNASKVLNTSYSYRYLESYDFVDYLDDDDDDDDDDGVESRVSQLPVSGAGVGVPNSLDGADTNPDGDSDGLIDGEDMLISAETLSSMTYWSDWQNYSYEVTSDQLDSDSDNDSLIDGLLDGDELDIMEDDGGIVVHPHLMDLPAAAWCDEMV